MKHRRLFWGTLWVLLIVTFIAYAVLVVSWWNEGTANFDRQRREACAKYLSDGTPRENIPAGCLGSVK